MKHGRIRHHLLYRTMELRLQLFRRHGTVGYLTEEKERYAEDGMENRRRPRGGAHRESDISLTKFSSFLVVVLLAVPKPGLIHSAISPKQVTRMEQEKRSTTRCSVIRGSQRSNIFQRSGGPRCSNNTRGKHQFDHRCGVDAAPRERTRIRLPIRRRFPASC